MTERRSRVLAGASLVALGLLLNKWALGMTLSPDGNIESPIFNAFIIAGQFALITAGVAVLTGSSLRPSPTVAKLGLLLGSLVIAILLAELAVRLLPSAEVVRAQPRIKAVVGEFPNRPNADFVTDSDLGWRMRPSHRFLLKLPEREIAYYANQQG